MGFHSTFIGRNWAVQADAVSVKMIIPFEAYNVG